MSMPGELIERTARTEGDGMLHLSVNVGIADADVTVTVRVKPTRPNGVDANGWPVGFFEETAGSIPDLERAPQGEFEQRTPIE